MASSSSTVSQPLAEIALESGKSLGFNMKDKQVEAVTSFLEGKDTFVSLPTGFGKSLIYAVLPIAFDTLRGKCHI